MYARLRLLVNGGKGIFYWVFKACTCTSLNWLIVLFNNDAFTLKVITRDLFICLVFYAPRWRNYCDLRDTYAYIGWLFPHWPPHAACDCKINNFSAGNYLSRSHLKICLLPSCVYYTAKKIPQPTNIASKSSVPFDAPSAPRASVDVEMQMKRARAAHHSLATIRQMKEDRSHLTEQSGLEGGISGEKQLQHRTTSTLKR